MIVRLAGGWTGRSRSCPPTVPARWPPSAQGSFARPGCYPGSGRPRGSPRRALPLLHRSYEPMRQTKTLRAPRLPPCARGLCRLLSAPAGRWPFPTLSLRPLRRCSDPYPATLLGCFCPLLRPRTPVSPHGKRVRRADLPPHSNFGGEPYIEAAVIRLPSGSYARSTSRLLRPRRPKALSRQAFHTTQNPAGYPIRAVASLRVRHGQLTRLDSHQLGRSLVGCSLPHTAYRRSSPAAFGFQARNGLGGTTIPSRLIRPRWFSESQHLGHPPTPSSAAFAPFGQPQREPGQGIVPDLAEHQCGVAEAEIPRPSAQEQVEFLHDPLDRHQQTGSGGDRPNPMPARVGTRLTRRPTTEEHQVRRPGVRPRTSRLWKPRKSTP